MSQICGKKGSIVFVKCLCNCKCSRSTPTSIHSSYFICPSPSASYWAKSSVVYFSDRSAPIPIFIKTVWYSCLVMAPSPSWSAIFLNMYLVQGCNRGYKSSFINGTDFSSYKVQFLLIQFQKNWNKVQFKF